jgi:hypothetical protein
MRMRLWAGLLGATLLCGVASAQVGGLKDPPASGTPAPDRLTGAARTEFINRSIEACLPGFRTQPRRLSETQARVYCRCASEQMADNFSLADIEAAAGMETRREQPSGRVQEIIMAAAQRCMPQAQRGG